MNQNPIYSPNLNYGLIGTSPDAPCAHPHCHCQRTQSEMADCEICAIAAGEAKERKEATRLGMQMALTLPVDSPLWGPVKMLCWKQPFASLMLPPYNKVETRTKIVNYRGLVLIVATEKPYRDIDLIKLCGGPRALAIETLVAGHDGYMNGCAIGIGYLHACRHLKDIDKTYLHPSQHTGRYGWFFKNVFAIEPIPMKGFQGWRNADVELRSRIKLLP